MESSFSLQTFLPFIIPLVILQLVMMIIGLIDLKKREKTRGPKWLWALLLILGQLWGPALYFIIGRGEE